MYIIVGSSRRLGQRGTLYRSLQIFVHPEYFYEWDPKFLLKTDIAVIRTLLPIRFNDVVQPIPFGVERVPDNSQITVLGWGMTDTNDVSFHLQICS